MTHSLSRASGARSAVRRTAGLAVAATLGLGGLAAFGAAPAHADTATHAPSGASATVADVVAVGNAIHLEGTGWTTSPGSGNGSTIGVKLGNLQTETATLGTEPKAGPVTNPADGTSADGFDIWAAIEADADGSFSADIPFPTPDNTAPAMASAWAVGSTHTLTLLTGSLETPDTARAVKLTFTIGDKFSASAATAATGVVTVSFSGGAFQPNEVLSVKKGDTPLQWTTTSGRTSTVSDTITASAAGAITSRVVLPAGSARAGNLTLTVTGDKGSDTDVTVQVPPAIAFSNGTALGATGTLTVSNLVNGATISQVKLGDVVLATDLTADGNGAATASYTIPKTIAPTTQPLVITQTAPDAQVYNLTQTVYPDETASGTEGYRITSTTEPLDTNSGLYQSAYSAAQDAVYATSSDRGTGADGFIYKLDADTLAIEDSVATVDHDGFTKVGAFGVGVDDEHGNVWVSNTGSNSVAVYREDNLDLVKQFPAGTVQHARDVVYDAAHDQVFVSSASEGTTGDGYISVFNADTLEKITDIATGPRTDFNPVSLSIGGGKVFSPSLQSNKVVSIDTATLQPTFITIDGINVGGRGASGIAYDAADDRLFIASQNSSEVVVADATTGETLKEVPTGKQALNVTWDPVNQRAYVANFGGTSVTVLDKDGNKVASLPIATVNHVTTDGKGDVFAVDKAAPNKVWRIAPTSINGAAALGGAHPSIEVTYGQDITFDGDNWMHPNATGSTIGVKLDGTGVVPTSGAPTNPVTGNPVANVWAVLEADDDGHFDATLPFPTAAATGSADTAWLPGQTHQLRLLTGSLETGDVARSVLVDVTITPAGTEGAVPTVTGTAKVGSTLTAAPGTWTVGTQLAYQWKRAGVAIAGATKASYTAVAADAGKALTVAVTGVQPGYTTVVKTSAAKTVAKGTLKVATPKVRGTAKVGRTLTAAAGTWTTGTTLKYQWLANGKVVKGATKKSLRITKALKGKKIQVRVTGSKTGYTTVAKTSAKTKAVKK